MVPMLVNCVFVFQNPVRAILGLLYQTVVNGGGESGKEDSGWELLYAITDNCKASAGPIWEYVVAPQTTRTLHRYKNLLFTYCF